METKKSVEPVVVDQEAVQATDAENQGNGLIVKFSKPYIFDGKEHTEVDLSGLEDVTANDIIAVNKIMARNGDGANIMPEMSMQFAVFMAARVTKLPVEFFRSLPGREAVVLKTVVSGFMFGAD